MSPYLPDLPGEELRELVDEVKDFQLNSGSLLKLVFTEDEHSVLSRPIGVSLFPSPYPSDAFREAQSLQPLFNELYANIAEDDDWLYETTKDLIATDRLASALWEIHSTVKSEGYVQELVLGIFRSDYMLQHNPDTMSGWSLKQVEFNTYSVAGGSHADKVGKLHRHLALNGIYEGFWKHSPCPVRNSRQPGNDTIEFLARNLAIAHQFYGTAKSRSERKTAVLFIVQPRNINTCDERPIEYALWHSDPPIHAYRVEFGSNLLARCRLGKEKELLFQPRSSCSDDQPIEISVAYLRAGYDPDEYDEDGCAARLLLARSRAINCPSILGHITTFKKVQQALSSDAGMQRFASSTEDASRLVETFGVMYPLDESHLGQRARKLAINPDSAMRLILKPSLEGGGHNVYGRDIPDFLSKVPMNQWNSFILMEQIDSPYIDNAVMSPSGLHVGPTTSELGIFGACLWRRPVSGKSTAAAGEARDVILKNCALGWSLKTKPAGMSEMSVVKGFGCFDSLLLVDHLDAYTSEMASIDTFSDESIRDGLAWYS